MKTKLIQFFRDEEGATAIEYGLIAGLISVGLLVALTDIGTSLQSIFGAIATSLGEVVLPGGGGGGGGGSNPT